MSDLEHMLIITNEQQLRQKSQKVSIWSGIRTGEKLMKFIVYNNIRCVGLAAPQVGIQKRVFVLYEEKSDNFAIFVNPRLLETGALQSEEPEGCVSMPGKTFLVARPSLIVVKDAMRTKPFELSGWTARAWQHEYDHLRGVIISDIAIKELNSQEIQPRFMT